MESTVAGHSSLATEQANSLVSQAQDALRESRQHLESLLLSLPAALYTTDLEGRITLYNDAAAEMWGRRPEIGQEMWCGSWKIFRLDGTPLPHDQCPMAICLLEGRGVRGEEVLIERPDGSRSIALPYPEPLRDAHGAMIGALNLLVDITERKQAEKKQREEDDWRSAIFGQVAVGLGVVDLQGRFLEVNNRLALMLGRPPAEFPDLTIREITHPDDLDRTLELHKSLAAGEISDYSFEKRYWHKDGSVVWVNVSASPLLGADGRPERLIAIIEDISERKRTEEDFRELNRMLEARVQDRTARLESFSYSIAHDLRQHIRGISLNTHWVRELLPNPMPELENHLTRLGAAAISMDRLVTDLLQYARLTKQESRRERVDLSHLASEIVSKAIAPVSNGDYRIQPHLEAVGDPAALEVVLHNLMENAAKYASPDRPARIEVGAESGAYFVRDNGIGFDMAYADQVFEPFQRLHRHSEIPGTGIGLASVKQIIENHGGKVWGSANLVRVRRSSSV